MSSEPSQNHGSYQTARTESGRAGSSPVGMNQLEHGRACYQRRAWSEAYDALRRADAAVPLDTGDLDRLATAAYLMGHEVEFQNTLERLYRVHLAAG